MNKLRDNIFVWDNAIEEAYCEDLVSMIDNKIGVALLERPEQSNRTTEGGITFSDNKKRLDTSLLLENYGSLTPARNLILKTLEQCLLEMSDAFPECGSPYINQCEPIVCKMQKTPPGGGFCQWHFEQGGTDSLSRRWGVWMLYLNTVEKGGKTDFPNQEMSVKPEAGKMVIWPAAYTHPHRSAPDLGEDKYIVTGWLVYPDRDAEREISRL